MGENLRFKSPPKKKKINWFIPGCGVQNVPLLNVVCVCVCVPILFTLKHHQDTLVLMQPCICALLSVTVMFDCHFLESRGMYFN